MTSSLTNDPSNATAEIRRYAQCFCDDAPDTETGILFAGLLDDKCPTNHETNIPSIAVTQSYIYTSLNSSPFTTNKQR